MSRKKKRKGWKTGRLHWPGSSHRGHDHGEEAARLTPLEETEAFKDSPQSDGKRDADTIRVDSSNVPMPESFLDDDEREGASIFKLEPVVVFILVVMLAFIAFVAWQITLMPEK
ncbi:MAG: hypothetical protein JOZ96_18735 [Acidobacteria bacterium]|nr:hypothetical protein [Acidobacteriota bacterium]